MQREIVRSAAVGVGVAEAPEGLSAIRHPGCAAVLWRRSPPPGFAAWIHGLAPTQLPRARLILPLDRIEPTVSALCADSGMPDGPERDWLIGDIAHLAALFLKQVPAPYLRLRLDPVSTNSCRRFHIDAVTARLICTYRGTGTQYGISTDGDAPRQVFTVPTASPFILRGTLWPSDPPAGLLHRSPPIEGTGETRLMLVLDPMTEPVEEI